MKIYLSSINKKIVTPNQLKLIIKKKYKNKIIGHCHGTFDIVHPGHIRHFIYAKQKADVLIASLTADKYITKKFDGTFLNEELRARNLAAISIIDYVVIDYNEKPLKLLNEIKPSFFLKGFEYSSLKNPNTSEEIKVLKKNNGEILFSPGDEVYSSTTIQNIYKPKLELEKLYSIMDSTNVSFNLIKKNIEKFNKMNVTVIGDTIIDKYVYTEILGQTNKTPTFSVKKMYDKLFLGGAGIVAMHLKSLGAKVKFISVIGKDKYGKFAKSVLNKFGVETKLIIDNLRPTTIKERFWAENYKLLQVDTLTNQSISEKYLFDIAKLLKSSDSQAYIFSDFRHGIFNKENIKFLSKALPKKAIKVADSQVSNRWGNILDFKHFDIIFPNEKEARFALADQDSPVRFLGTEILKKSKSKFLILKLSERGILVYKKTGLLPKDFYPIGSFVKNLVDGIGAGDALLAASTLSYLTSNKNILVSSIVGNIAAAIACEQQGNIPIKNNQLLKRLKEIAGDFQ